MYKFICETADCINHTTEILFEEATEFIWCPQCQSFSNRIEIESVE